jgi:hypothetical protein
MPRNQNPEAPFPVRLTQAQRKAVAEIVPELADRLKLDERNQRTIPFTLAELKAIKEKARRAVRHASTGMVRNSLRHLTDLTAQALECSRGVGAIPTAERLYQFKFTLLNTEPGVSGSHCRPRTRAAPRVPDVARRAVRPRSVRPGQGHEEDVAGAARLEADAVERTGTAASPSGVP